MSVYGNVNVDYKPCKAVGQLQSAVDYILGEKENQKRDGIIKTRDDLFNALGCNRHNFANNILINRKMHGKSYSKLKDNDILAHKLSLSFSKIDSQSLSYKTAYHIGEEFAEHFFYKNGYQVLFAVHTDKEHTHIHFIISNCNIHNGKSYRRNQKDLREMSEFFGMQCKFEGLKTSIRDSYYSKDKSRVNLTFNELQMRKTGKESFKDELREVIDLELQEPHNNSLNDVIKSLYCNYGIETRIAGNTISYRHPHYKDKNGNLVSVRASKLGEKYTKKGIEYEYTKYKNRTNSETDYGGKDNAIYTHPPTANIYRGTEYPTNANSRGETKRQRTSSIESTVSGTSLSSGQLQNSLSEIREYHKRFNPEYRRKSKQEHMEKSTNVDGIENIQSNVIQTDGRCHKEPSR